MPFLLPFDNIQTATSTTPNGQHSLQFTVYAVLFFLILFEIYFKLFMMDLETLQLLTEWRENIDLDKFIGK